MTEKKKKTAAWLGAEVRGEFLSEGGVQGTTQTGISQDGMGQAGDDTASHTKVCNPGMSLESDLISHVMILPEVNKAVDWKEGILYADSVFFCFIRRLSI